MHFARSCSATSELLQCKMAPYIRTNEAACQVLNRQYKETPHVALDHPHGEGVPGLSAQRQRAVPTVGPRTGRYRPRSLGHPARCRRFLQGLTCLTPDVTDNARDVAGVVV